MGDVGLPGLVIPGTHLVIPDPDRDSIGFDFSEYRPLTIQVARQIILTSLTSYG